MELVRSFADDNHVILHCRQMWPGDVEYAAIDIFGLDNNGTIVEHWDVLQLLPDHSNDANGMF